MASCAASRTTRHSISTGRTGSPPMTWSSRSPMSPSSGRTNCCTRPAQAEAVPTSGWKTRRTRPVPEPLTPAGKRPLVRSRRPRRRRVSAFASTSGRKPGSPAGTDPPPRSRPERCDDHSSTDRKDQGPRHRDDGAWPDRRSSSGMAAHLQGGGSMETDSQPAGHDVVVALDVADVSRKALDWAAAYARQAGARLRAVHVITVDAQGVEGWGATPSGYSADDPLLRRYREQIQQLFDGSHPEPE